MTLHQLIERSARHALALQQPDGAMPAGHNGPYDDPERPTRNTAHWLITFCWAARQTGDPVLRTAAMKAANYLTSPAARPMGATFWCRSTPSKDFSNGLVGQAWVIEALGYAAGALERPDLASLARDVFLAHPFDSEKAAWKIVNVDGSHRGFDYTFNHQLWFAAAGATIPDAPAVRAPLTRFLDRLPTHLALYRNGLIRHLSPGFLRSGLASSRQFWRLNARPADRHHLKFKSAGYHGFNLHGLALLKQRYPQHPFWQTRLLQQAVDYVDDPAFHAAIDDNHYGYPYNPLGFEVAYALQTFRPSGTGADTSWVHTQLARHYDMDARALSRNTVDPNTLAARLYEATRLKDVEVEIAQPEINRAR